MQKNEEKIECLHVFIIYATRLIGRSYHAFYSCTALSVVKASSHYGFDMRDRVLTVIDLVLTILDDINYVLKHSATVEIMMNLVLEK